MMKFAVNYSNPLIRLIKEKAIEIDLIKCPDWEGMLKEARPYGPITIHYDIHIGTGEIQTLDLDRVRCFMKQTATPHVNAHLVTPMTALSSTRSTCYGGRNSLSSWKALGLKM